MAITERDETYVMDLTVLLKALREARQDAAQVVQQLQERLQACRDLDTRAATTLTQAVQRATASLQQEQERTIARVSGEASRYHEGLTQQLQRMVEQAARVRWWLPWKVALLLLGATLLVNAAGAIWWWRELTTERQALQQTVSLATDLHRYLRETLYAQLPAARKQDIDTIYRAHQLTSPGHRLP